MPEPGQEQQQQQQQQQQQSQQQQSQQVDWVTTLEPGHKELVTTKGWKSPGDIVKGYSELEKLVGLEKIPMPAKDKDGNFTPDGVKQVLTRLGLPKEAKEYVLPKEIQVAEGAGLTTQQLEAFKPIAHKYGLLPGQYQGIMQDFVAMLNQGVKVKADGDTKQHDESVAALRQEYGTAYDSKVKLANTVLRSFVDKTRADALVQKYGNDPDVIKLLANIGENMGEEVLQQNNMSGGVLTPAEAEGKIREIKANPQHPYFNASHPEHEYWVKEVDRLYKMAVSGQQQ